MAGMKPSHNAADAKRIFDIITEENADRFATWCIFFKRSKASPFYAW
jgi:hypothetical protein